MSYITKATGPYTLTTIWYVDGTATDVGTVTIGITDANGDEVVAAGTATVNNTDGTYTYTLASQPDVNVLTVTWTRTDTGATLVSALEVLGSELFIENDVRTYRTSGQQTPFSSSTDYPDETIARWHMVIADMMEQRTGRSWISRYARVVLPGSGGYRLNLRNGRPRIATGTLTRPGRFYDIRQILSATVGGVTVDTADIVVDGTILHRTSGSWNTATVADPLNVVVEFEYGTDPSPWEASENALRLFAANASPSDVSAYATSWNNEDGTFRIATWPVKVEEWLRKNRWKAPFA